MSIVQWDGSLATGIHELDAQHEYLFTVINNLHEKIRAMPDRTALESTLDSLRQYVKYHFYTEERLMETYGYGDRGAHKVAHDKFALEVEKMALGEDHEMEERLNEVLAFLMGWLVQHIQATDLKLGAFLRTKGLR